MTYEEISDAEQKQEFDLKFLTRILDECEDFTKIALEYMQEREDEISPELKPIEEWLEEHVKHGGFLELQKINYMLFLGEKTNGKNSRKNK